MPAVTSFGFRLGKQVYLSGETVHGEVIVDLAKPINTKGIRLKVNGRAKVKWTSGSGKNKHTHTNKETYLRQFIMVLGQENHDITIPQGQHLYPFQLQLPVDCPSSFNGRHGQIEYYIRAEIIRIGLKSNNTSGIKYNVVRVVDLNRDPVIAQPIDITQTEILSTCCCAGTGPVTATIGLERRGYVPGETANISITVNNKAGFEVVPILQLIQETEFRSRGGSHKRVKDVVFRTDYDRLAGGNGYKKQTQFQIPQLSTPLEGCNIMQNSLRFKLKVDSISLKTPLLIGNVCLRPEYNVAPVMTQPIGWGTTPVPSHMDEPPSYFEATKGGVNVSGAQFDNIEMSETATPSAGGSSGAGVHGYRQDMYKWENTEFVSATAPIDPT